MYNIPIEFRKTLTISNRNFEYWAVFASPWPTARRTVGQGKSKVRQNRYLVIVIFDIFFHILVVDNTLKNTALLWQKEASDKSDISCKRAKCVCHLHWRQWNIMMSYLTYLLAGWVFMHKIWPGRRAHQVKYKNTNNSNLDGMSLASFCQSRAEYF